MTNTGSADDTFTLSTAGLPAGGTARFAHTSLDVPPGVSNLRDVPLVVTVPQGTRPGSYPFTVTATSTSAPTATSTTNGMLVVSADGVKVSLDPSSGAPGTGFQETVTNTGTVADTYTLELAGPGALVSSLGTKQVTLAPGASRIVPISTGAVNFAVQGDLNLMAMATSTANPAVQAAATAALSIPATVGMTASFSPSSQPLAKPGPASFLLTVQNTGNTEDSYTATIIGTSGPVTANLVGLDGSPTQSIPIFRLPGLSAGVILVQTILSEFGQGTVTVRVTSLNHGDITSTAVATVSATSAASGTPAVPPIPADGPEITLLQRYGIHRMPTTLVVHFNQTLDPALAQDVHEYQLVGPRGRIDPITRAAYDPATMTVTLDPERRVNFHKTYRLTVDGTSPSGLADAQGLLLNSTPTQPGSDDVVKVDWRNLVWPDPRRKSTGRDQTAIAARSTIDYRGWKPFAYRDYSQVPNERSTATPAARGSSDVSCPPGQHALFESPLAGIGRQSASGWTPPRRDRQRPRLFQLRPGRGHRTGYLRLDQ